MAKQEMISIPKKEYETLKKFELKVKIIEETLHEDISIKELMKVQSSQRNLAFLSDKEEDIYTEEDAIQ